MPPPSSPRHTALSSSGSESWSPGEGSLSRRSLQPSQLLAPGASAKTRRFSATPARKPVRSSPLAGPALSPNPGQLRRSSLSTPDFNAQRGPATPQLHSRAKSLHTINSHDSPYPGHSRTLSSSSKDSSRQKLTKRPQLKIRTSTASPSYDPARSASTPNITQSSALTRIKTTDSSASDDKSWLTFSPLAETPRFTRLGLGGQNVVMPLSAKDYQRKRRETLTSTPNLPAPTPRTLPTAHVNPNWRRSRSFTHIEKDVFGRHRQALVADKEDYGASGYHLPISKLPHPRRLPSLTRSSSTDSSASDSAQYSIPFTSTTSSASSVVTVVEPQYNGATTESFPGPLPVSLVTKKSQRKSSHSHHSFISFPNALRPPRDDEGSVWSVETMPPLRSHRDVPPPSKLKSDEAIADAPLTERKRRKSLTARLMRAFSRKRNPT